MSSTTSENFQQLYAVAYSSTNGTYTTTSSNLLTKGNTNETVGYSSATVTAPDKVTLTSSATGGLNGTYTYVGAVETGGSYVGILVTNGSNYYLVDSNPGGSTTLASGTALTVQTGVGWDLATSSPACFMAGTMISTPGGDVAVEALKAGDLVTLNDGHAGPISWLGRRTVSTVFADSLIRCA
jgi:hypothetical protein